MVSFNATPVVMVAAAVWVTWRTVIWRKRGGDLVRELGLAGLLLMSLAIVSVTFFPLRIIFYDWHGSANFIPFASIRQLATQTSAAVAVRNILGNIVLFIPLGFALPLLFDRMRSWWALLWRAAVISVAIESLQVFTRARAVDVDDVILNTAGASVGFLLFLLARAVLTRSERGRGWLARLGESPGREPLLVGLGPVLATAAIVVPMMLATINGATLSGQGVDDDATSLWSGSTVVTRQEVDGYLFVLVHEQTYRPELLGLVGYEVVLPGRYTRTSWGDMTLDGESRFKWSLTAFNTTREEIPVVAIWGENSSGATSMVVRNVGLEERVSLDEARFFVVLLPYDVERLQGLSGVLEDFEIRFYDGSGSDLTDRFENSN